jgi:uncharacterized protein YxjI
MACNITLSDQTLDCRDSMGGIVEVYALADRADITAISTTSGSTGMITGFTLVTQSHGFVTYKLRKNTASLVNTYNISEENGTTFVRSELTLVFPKMDTPKRLEISALAIGNMAMIVKDSNCKYWFLGKYEPVTMASGTSQTGVSKGDKNGYDVVLCCEGPEEPWEVTAAAVEALLAM